MHDKRSSIHFLALRSSWESTPSCIRMGACLVRVIALAFAFTEFSWWITASRKKSKLPKKRYTSDEPMSCLASNCIICNVTLSHEQMRICMTIIVYRYCTCYRYWEMWSYRSLKHIYITLSPSCCSYLLVLFFTVNCLLWSNFSIKHFMLCMKKTLQNDKLYALILFIGRLALL